MKGGRKSWTTKVSAELLQRCRERVEARVQTDRDVYNQLGLGTHNVKWGTFRTWAVDVRKNQAARTPSRFGFNQTGTGTSDAPSVASDEPVPAGSIGGRGQGVDGVIQSCIDAIGDALLAGRIGKLQLGPALKSLAQLKELELAQNADKRAEELHATKIAKARPAAEAAMQSPTTEAGKTFRDVLEQVAAGKLAVEAAVPALNDVLWVELDKQMRGAA